MYKDDALTRYTREAGQQIMMLVMAQPQGARSDVVRAALEAIQPGLHAKVDRLAGAIAAKGVSTLMAYEEALRLALADVFVDAVKALGRTKATGRVDDTALSAQRLFYGQPDEQAVSGLGSDLGLGDAAKDAARFGLNLLRAAACSDAVRTAVTSTITSKSTLNYTNAGLDVARGVASCSTMPGATPPAPTPPAPPAEPSSGAGPAEESKTSTYVIAGAAVLGLGAIMFFALRK